MMHIATCTTHEKMLRTHVEREQTTFHPLTRTLSTAIMEGIMRPAAAGRDESSIVPTVPHSSCISIRFGFWAGYPITLRILFMEHMFISFPATISSIPLPVAISKVVAAHTLVDSSSLVGLNRPRDAAVGVNARTSAATIYVAKQ